MTSVLQIACLGVFAATLSIAAWQDWRTLQIADLFPLTIVGAFCVWALGGYVGGRLSLVEVGLAVAGAIAFFAVGVVAFALGMLGGGDVKLLAAASLFAAPPYLADFLMALALSGGVLALAVLVGMRIGTAPSDGARRRLPYGPAIAAGGLWVAVLRLLA